MTPEAAAGAGTGSPWIGGNSSAAPDILLSTGAGDSRIAFGPLAALPDLADPTRTVLVTDALVRRHVPSEYPADRIVEVPRGEAAKSHSCLESVYRHFLELGLGRDGTVLAVGGGSVSDLAGFAASTWMRGVDFGFAPTTVLAMVDASVGGKNGIDFGGFKNLVGSFRLPRFVLVDPEVLSTLPARQAAAGLVEAVKHAVIEGPEHLALLESAIPARAEGAPFALSENAALLIEILSRSIRLKARVVESDFRESGVRRKLNLGHTIGHAVEAVTGLPHGECVAAGLACALGLAVRRGGSGEGARRVLDLLGRLGVPRSLEEARMTALADAAAAPDGVGKALSSGGALPEPPNGPGGPGGSGAAAVLSDPAAFRRAVAGILGTDKKRAGQAILFALPRAPGSVEIEPIELAELEEYVREAP